MYVKKRVLMTGDFSINLSDYENIKKFKTL